ncbi:MAG TPA: BatA domain-containing protein, partial [Pirellulales bacterium]|nr:BatA domain-containing protein [Pirellulales bacterium]
MKGLGLLLAFGFGNTLMLSWLAAAAVPLAIHLWNRRRYREVSWAAIEYLLAALKKNSRRMQIEQWLLLAIRTLIVILVALAVAEPYLEGAHQSFSTGQRTLKMIVIDGSYSMAYRPTDRSRFERAKQAAQKIVEDSPAGDAFLLVTLADPPVVVVGSPAHEPSDFLAEIDALRLVQGLADLPATLARVEEVLNGAGSSAPARREVYFLTDLCRNTWAPQLVGPAAEAEYRQRLARLAERAALVVVDVGQSGAENAAVTGLALSEPLAAVGREVVFDARLQSFGGSEHRHQLVELLIDGHRAGETSVDLVPGETARAAFSYRFDAPGQHVAEVRLAADALDLDNHRWLVVRVKDQLRVLCVDGKPAGGGLSGATDYLALALNPDSGESDGAALVKPEVVPESALVERDLANYDCVFLANVGQFTASEASLLESYLKQGGGIVFFLGDQVLADRYDRELIHDRGGVLPARIGALAPEGQYHFDPLEYRHPLVKVFQDREAAGLLTTPNSRYFRLEPRSDVSARVALAFADGDPAIVEAPLYRGRSVLVATDGSLSSVDPQTKSPWTTLPAWPSFVPLVQEMLALVVSGQARDQTVTVLQPLTGNLPAGGAGTPLRVVEPDGHEDDLTTAGDASNSGWSFADTWQSGIYRVRLGPVGADEELFVANVDTAESDLARVEPGDLPREFTTGIDAATEEIAPPTGRQSHLNRDCLYVALGLLLTETLL